MKKITIIFFLFIFALSINAQVTDKKAEKILKEASEKAKSHKSIKIKFTYKMVNKKEGIDESKIGTVNLKGDMYKLNIEGQTVFCDAKTVWTYIQDANEVHINVVPDDEESVNPANIFNSYNKTHRAKLINEYKSKSGLMIYKIDLTPKKGKSYFKLRLYINKANKQILKFAIYEKSGTTFSYLINKYSTNVEISDSEFKFDKKDYPKVEVIDMR